jgi:recombination protein RecT
MSESRAIAPWQQFEAELASRSEEIAAILPANVSRERFMRTAVIAVKNNPDILAADRRSVQQAVTRAAEDGLQPDGREGVINVYKEKQPDETWRKVAAWIPMTHGIRKRALEIAGLIIDAQVVCKADRFVWRQGDNPVLQHDPAPLDEDPGPRIGAYAVIRRADGTVLHREVMRKAQLDTVKSTVRAQRGLMWTKFEDEAWRKTVVRRAAKTVPAVPEALQRILERDNDDYDLGPPVGLQSLGRAAAALPPPAPPEIPDAPPPPPLAAAAPPDVPDHDPETGEVKPTDAEFLAGLEGLLGQCVTEAAIAEAVEANKAEVEERGLEQAANDLVGKHRARLAKAAAKATPKPRTKTEAEIRAEETYVDICRTMQNADGIETLAEVWKLKQDALKTLPANWRTELAAEKDRIKAQLQQAEGAAA